MRLEEGHADVILFRWHLGSNAEPEIAPVAGGFRVVWDDAQMLIGSPGRLAVSAIKAPDNTVNNATDDARPETFHTCIVIASAEPAERLAVDVSVGGR